MGREVGLSSKPNSKHLWRKGRYGPAALVTGASDGIGREFARALAKKGLNLVLVARRRDQLDGLAQELGTKHAIDVVVIDADLGTATGVENVVRDVEEIDVGLLVAAAGFGTSGPLIQQALDNELNMIDVNCSAVVALSHAFGQRFAARGSGGIVLMSSIVAFQGVPRSANYAATKAFIQSLAEGLKTELKPHGVDVIAAAPGPIASGFGKRANMTLGLSEPPSAVAETTLRALGRKTTVRPGRLSKFLGNSIAILPRWARVMVMTQIMKGMTEAPPRPKLKSS